MGGAGLVGPEAGTVRDRPSASDAGMGSAFSQAAENASAKSSTVG